ncbi:MAG: hypothetical protein HRJ53_01510 [Acidobacteria bacterium Pan2503]|uniref:Uncharacterized protein n=1 Tax=Candidatus Acidiferrum panamense TaxID=2741543 RepID=A0A7V8NLR6_9BACT|nr:hypothetical protein [Candidatus Acidoferrum panamensis]
MKHLFIMQNQAGRVIHPEWTSRAGATRRNNRLRREGQPLRLVEVADLNYLWNEHGRLSGTCGDCGRATADNKLVVVFVRDEQAKAWRCLDCDSLNVSSVYDDWKAVSK